jgi:hypothetical protein
MLTGELRSQVDKVWMHEDKLAVAKLRTNKSITPTDLQELKIMPKE